MGVNGTDSELCLKAHRIRFFYPELSSINFMTYSEENQKLALIRRRIRKYKANQSDTQSVIEIWNLQTKTPFTEQTIYDDCDNPSLLESLVWGPKGRLFSGGLNSYINEYDLKNNCIQRSYSVRSGPVWCMALDESKSLIAVGTEDGDITVFRIDENGLEFNKIMDRNDKRILCLQWHKPKDNTSPLIVCSTIDFIKIWNYQTGRCVDHIQVSSNQVIVWCLTVLSDFTIVSGDSRGTTSFWNGNSATLINSFNAHKGDVLSICSNADESIIYSSGVDSDIVTFDKIRSDDWIRSLIRKVHTHDIRAMTCVRPNILLSGGVDSYLGLSTCPPNPLNLRFLSNHSSAVTVIKSHILLQFESFLEIWRLGETDCEITQTNDVTEILPLSENVLKFAEIKTKLPVIRSSFSNDWVVYSNSKNIKIKIWSEKGVKNVPVLCEPICRASHINFAGENCVAIASGTDVHILKLDEMGVVLITKLEFDHKIYSMTSTQKYLIVCTTDPKKTIKVYETNNWTEMTSFPNNYLPTSIAINETNECSDLWLAYPDRKILRFDLKVHKFVKTFKVRECLPKHIYQTIDEFWSIKQICFATDSVLFSDDNTLYKLNLKSGQMTKCNQYRHILHMANIGDNEIVIVEMTSEMLFHRLPQALSKKKFGV